MLGLLRFGNERFVFTGFGRRAAQQECGDGAEERGGDGREGAQQALGVSGVLVETADVDGSLEEVGDATIDPCGKVVIRVEYRNVMGRDTEARDRDESHERPVTEEEDRDDGEELRGAAGVKADEASDKVAEGDAGEHAVDAEAREVKVRVEVEEEVERENDDGAAEDVKGEFFSGLAAGDAGLEREDDGGADHEEEVGEDEVGEGEAVPCCVVELGVGVGPVAGVVDENHEGDGEAAEDVDGEDSVGRGGAGDGSGHWVPSSLKWERFGGNFGWRG